MWVKQMGAKGQGPLGTSCAPLHKQCVTLCSSTCTLTLTPRTTAHHQCLPLPTS